VTMVTVIDYGMGNLGSIRNMLKKLGAEIEITSDPRQVLRATKIILPGVGAFDAGMQKLLDSNLVPALNEQVLVKRVPTLGICLGMHLMTRGSEEGMLRGLAWIEAETALFRPAEDSKIKVPHMGWNVTRRQKTSALLNDVETEERYYFVHSYYVRCKDRADVLLTAEHGELFDAAFQRDNVMGVQFHPEKSHHFGLSLLKNFVERC
jgi:imidazole glycerol-phosphate synthase subunit HisH